MKILISGINGFVGTNLVKALSPTHQIYGVDITQQQTEGVVTTYNWMDINSKKVPEVDVIIHLAGKAHDTKNYAKAEEYFTINTGLTEKIFSYFLNSKAEKFIFFSSVKAVADKVEGVLTEDVHPAPVGPYAESKLAAERAIGSQLSAISIEQSAVSSQQSVEGSNKEQRTKNEEQESQNSQLTTQNKPLTTHNSLLTTNKKVYILRPSMIHGPGNKGNLNLLYGIVKRGLPWPLGAYDNRRSFTSIDNLSFVISELIERNIPAGIYNISDDEALSTNEVISIIRAVQRSAFSVQRREQSAFSTQHSVGDEPKLTTHNSLLTTKIISVPKPVIKALATFGTWLHLPLNKDRLNKLTENYVVSNAKIKKALGITAMPVSAVEGLRRTIESFK